MKTFGIIVIIIIIIISLGLLVIEADKQSRERIERIKADKIWCEKNGGRVMYDNCIFVPK